MCPASFSCHCYEMPQIDVTNDYAEGRIANQTEQGGKEKGGTWHRDGPVPLHFCATNPLATMGQIKHSAGWIPTGCGSLTMPALGGLK